MLDHRRLNRLTNDRRLGLPFREGIFKRTIYRTTLDDLQPRIVSEEHGHAER
jgi:hypothetical protein